MSEQLHTDEEVGRALRKIAEAIGQTPDQWDWYAQQFVRWSTREGAMKRLRANGPSVVRSRIYVDPPDAVDGVLEYIVEMMTGKACCSHPWPHDPSETTAARANGVGSEREVET